MIPNWSIEASHIKALELVEAKDVQELAPPVAVTQAEFVDPAILSVKGKYHTLRLIGDSSRANHPMTPKSRPRLLLYLSRFVFETNVLTL